MEQNPSAITVAVIGAIASIAAAFITAYFSARGTLSDELKVAKKNLQDSVYSIAEEAVDTVVIGNHTRVQTCWVPKDGAADCSFPVNTERSEDGGFTIWSSEFSARTVCVATTSESGRSVRVQPVNREQEQSVAFGTRVDTFAGKIVRDTTKETGLHVSMGREPRSFSLLCATPASPAGSV